MTGKYCVIIFFVGSLAWLAISIAFLIGTLVFECYKEFIPYGLIFLLLHILLFISFVVYAIKLWRFEDCKDWPFITVMVLLGVFIIIFEIFMIGKGVLFPYGVGFNDVCSSLVPVSSIANTVVLCLVLLGYCVYKLFENRVDREEDRSLIVNDV
jgi:hypothetical protein